MRILDPIPNAKILSLLLTLQCNASCGNCGTHSSPHVKGRIARATAEDLIDQAADLGFELVVFTGGEPMMYGRDIRHLIARAGELGLSTRMVTNGYWATTKDRAYKIVRDLADHGLREINFSTGDEHAAFVPIDYVVTGCWASVEVGLPVSVMIETMRDSGVGKTTIEASPLFRELFGGFAGEAVNFCESPWMPLDEKVIAAYPEGFTADSSNVATKPGCDSIINTTTVLADGRIMACCGLGTQTIRELEVGHIARDRLVDVDRRMRDDFLKLWIKVEGPERILAWAAEKDPSIDWEGRYAHRCQACKRLYADPKVGAAVRAWHEEKIADVVFQEWLMHNLSTDAVP